MIQINAIDSLRLSWESQTNVGTCVMSPSVTTIVLSHAFGKLLCGMSKQPPHPHPKISGWPGT